MAEIVRMRGLDDAKVETTRKLRMTRPPKTHILVFLISDFGVGIFRGRKIQFYVFGSFGHLKKRKKIDGGFAFPVEYLCNA